MKYEDMSNEELAKAIHGVTGFLYVHQYDPSSVLEAARRLSRPAETGERWVPASSPPDTECEVWAVVQPGKDKSERLVVSGDWDGYRWEVGWEQHCVLFWQPYFAPSPPTAGGE